MTTPSRDITRNSCLHVALFFSAAFLLSRPAPAQTFELIHGHKAVPNEVLVKFRPGTRMESAVVDGGFIMRAHDLRLARTLNAAGLHHLRSASKSAARLVEELSTDPDVEYAEPNYIVEALATPTTPNDPMFSLLWSLQNTGQSGGVPNADIQAAQAWTVTMGSRSSVVGVVDTGIDYLHPDLAANVWSAPAAFTVQFGPHDQITCAAGTHGYHAITNTCNPMDQNGHGTHVSGTIGAAGNNSAGVTGVNWTASMIGLRFMDSTGKGTVANAIRAIQFAVLVKAALPVSANIKVLCNSWGGMPNSQALSNAIDQANLAGILFVAAAGNDGVNTDSFPTYPGAYRTANVITVAATDNSDALASFSNYGNTSVDLGAPGVNIASTYPNSGYATMSGTSMSAPHVAGAAALVLSACPALDTPALRAALVGNVDADIALTGKTVSGGRLNVYKAVASCATGNAAPVNTTPGNVVAGFSLSAPAAIGLVVGGAPASVTLTPSAVGGFNRSISLKIVGLPGGLTASVTPAAVTPGTPFTLKVTALPSAVAGSYNFTVMGTSGNINYSVIVSVTVSLPPIFKLTASPATASVQAGNPSTFLITPLLIGNFTGTIALQVSGLPPYATTTFTPQGGGSTTVAMAITTTKRTPPRAYSVVVIGTAPNALGTGTLKQSVPVTLTVTP